MKNKRMILADCRQSATFDVPAAWHQQYRQWADELGLDLELVIMPERRLEAVAAAAQAGDGCSGLLILRDPESPLSDHDMESFLVATTVPVVEVFTGDIGLRECIDRTFPGRRILRTIYGRMERGVFWGLHFLRHCRDHPYQTLAYGAGGSHIGDLFLPEDAGSHPVVMLIHGGFWRDGYRRDSTHGIAADLARRGLAVWNIEYRRVGPSGGGYPETHVDIFLALNHILELAQAFPLDTRRLAAVGHSAGGYLSLWGSSIPEGHFKSIMPAPRLPVSLGVSLAGVSDLDKAHESGGGDQAATHFLKGAAGDPLLRRQLSAGYLEYAAATSLILAHGTDDDYVPLELSEYSHELLKQHGRQTELVVYPDTGHNEFVDPTTPVWEDVARRITAALAGAPQ